MSGQRSRGGLLTAGALLTAPVLIAGLLVGFTMVGSAVACAPAAAAGVDPGNVPRGPIAGYGHQQLVNAAWIMKAAADLDLSLRDQRIGVMTAMGESGLRVLNHGDAAGPDSRGLFQQRANGAWGSLQDRTDPYISATNFFKALKTLSDRDTMQPTLVAHKVQRNADPYYYVRFWRPAIAVVAAITGAGNGSAVTLVSNPTSQYQLGGVQSQTSIVANTLGSMFDIKTVGGYRRGDADPYGHTVGLALDFMINDLRDGTGTGNRLAAYAKDHADELGVAYVVWRQRIWSVARSDEGWRAMPDRGNPTDNHFDHVHLSLTGAGSTDLVVEDAAMDCLPTGAISADEVDALMPAARSNPRTATQAIAWAQKQIGATVLPDGTVQSGHCLRLVTLAFGHTSGYLYAYDVWTSGPENLKHHGDWNPPPGAVVIWSNAGGLGGGAGHIGISIGGGQMISTSNTTVRIMPIRGNNYVPDSNYVGWMPPLITA